MTDLPAALRARLAEQVPFSSLAVEEEAQSRDGTEKVLFRTGDGHPVEAVLMRFRDGRRSICVSSQSGCPLTCTFCATGSMAFGRNLTASEIVDQALHFRRIERIDHAVFMGMGEPMLNLDEVVAAARRLPDLGVTHRRTTISTVGWMPGLRRFVDEVEEPIRLALSLHAPEDALRSALMPVNERYPLADVLAECRRYVELRRRKVFVEYVMLAGVNDRVGQARQLAALLEPKGTLQGQPDPVQPDRRRVHRLVAARDRRVRGDAAARRRARDDPPHARPRHRRRLRPAGERAARARRVRPSAPRSGRRTAHVARLRRLLAVAAPRRFPLRRASAACSCTSSSCADRVAQVADELLEPLRLRAATRAGAASTRASISTRRAIAKESSGSSSSGDSTSAPTASRSSSKSFSAVARSASPAIVVAVLDRLHLAGAERPPLGLPHEPEALAALDHDDEAPVLEALDHLGHAHGVPTSRRPSSSVSRIPNGVSLSIASPTSSR